MRYRNGKAERLNKSAVLFCFLNSSLMQQNQHHENCHDRGSYIFLPFENKRVRYLLREIIYFKAESNQASIHFIDKRTPHILNIGLKQLEEMLGECCFVRCHNSFIVHLCKIKYYKSSNGNHVVLDGGNTIAVSGNYIDYFLKRLQRIDAPSPTFINPRGKTQHLQLYEQSHTGGMRFQIIYLYLGQGNLHCL